MKSARCVGIEREIKLLFPIEFETGLAQRIVEGVPGDETMGKKKKAKRKATKKKTEPTTIMPARAPMARAPQVPTAAVPAVMPTSPLVPSRKSAPSS